MTSNVGAAELANSGTLGFYDGSAADVRKAEDRQLAIAKKHFKPEFINRVDELVVFRKLDQEALIKIIDLELDKLRKLLADRHLTLTVSDEVKKYLVEHDFDPEYGARPLRRAVEHNIEDPLAEELLRGTFTGATGVKVELDQQKILIFPEKA
jgi:ATP-dependent Clp protease ATP-binding subunit ClpC